MADETQMGSGPYHVGESLSASKMNSVVNGLQEQIVALRRVVFLQTQVIDTLSQAALNGLHKDMVVKKIHEMRSIVNQPIRTIDGRELPFTEPV